MFEFIETLHRLKRCGDGPLADGLEVDDGSLSGVLQNVAR